MDLIPEMVWVLLRLFDSGNGLGITPSIETKVPENLDVDLLDHIDTDLVPVKLSDIGVEDAIEQMLDMIN